MTDTISFGSWVRAQRKRRDLTQEELAEQVGCAATTLRLIEAGRRRASKDLAARLAHVLGVAPSEQPLVVSLARSPAPSIAAPALPDTRFRGPFPPTPLVGREEELEEVAQMLADPACRVVTLVGLGG